MRRYFLLLLLTLTTAGCKREAQKPAVPEPVEAGSGDYYRAGQVGMRIESVRLGKIRMRGMMGQDGESKDDVFIVHTRFKIFEGGPVKQPALQRDGGLISFGEGGLKLTGANGNLFKQVSAAGFDGVKGRRSEDAILTAENPEATDVLTFESVAGADGDLTLEIPANYRTQTPEGHFIMPKEPGTYRFRIPKAVWSAAPPSTEGKPGNWATVGPLSVSVESVRVGKIKLEGLRGPGESQEDTFAISIVTKLTNPAVRVKKPPFMPDSRAGVFGGSPITLRAAGGSEAFQAMGAFGLDRVVDRQQGDAELTPEKPETRDLLTFTAKAGEANELLLTIYPQWQEQKPDGTWADTAAEGEFRFRLPRSLWAK